MRLEYPWLLIGLLALIVPIIIHLYNWKKFKKVYFPDISMLEALAIETKKYAQIKNWKLLLTRLGLITLLILAFTKPFFPSADKDISAYHIFIDNSESLNFGEGQVTKLQQVKNSVIQLLKQLPEGQKTKIWTNYAQYDVVNKEEAIQWVQSIVATEHVSNIATVFQKQTAANSQWFVFSDFQKETFIPDSLVTLIDNQNINIQCIELPALPKQNIYIDTAYFLHNAIDINKNNGVVVKIKNAIPSGFTTQLQLQQQHKTTSLLSIDAEQDTYIDTIEVRFNQDEWQQLTWSIQDESLTFDDTFRMSWRNQASQTIEIFNDGATNNYLQAALQSFERYQITNASIAQIKSKVDANLIILQNIKSITPALKINLEEWWQAGKDVLLLPNEDLKLASFNQQLYEVTGINMSQWVTEKHTAYKLLHQHTIFSSAIAKMPDQVTLPTTLKHIKIQANLKSSPLNLISYRDGSPFLSQYKINNGGLTILSAPLQANWNNFSTSDFFAPFLYNLAQNSNGQNQFTTTITTKEGIKVPNEGQGIWKLDTTEGTIAPPQKAKGNWVQVFLEQSLNHSGYYQLTNEANSKAITLAVNKDNLESQLQFANKEDVAKLFQQPNKINWLSTVDQVWSNTQHATFPIWKILGLLAIVLLGLEFYWAIIKK